MASRATYHIVWPDVTRKFFCHRITNTRIIAPEKTWYICYIILKKSINKRIYFNNKCNKITHIHIILNNKKRW